MGSTFSKKKIRPQEPKTITECCDLIVRHGGDYIYNLPSHLLYITYNGGRQGINNQILITAIKHNFDLSKNKFDPKLLIHHKFYNKIDPMELLIAKNIENIKYVKEKYDQHIFLKYFIFAIDNPDFNLTHMNLLDWDATSGSFECESSLFLKIAKKLYNRFKNEKDSDEYFDLVPYKYKNSGMFERSVLKDIKNVSLAHHHNYNIIFAHLKSLSDDEIASIKLPYFDTPEYRIQFYSDFVLNCPKLIRCIPKEENLLNVFKHIFKYQTIKFSDIEVLFSVIPHDFFSDMDFFCNVIKFIYRSGKPEFWNYIPSSCKTTEMLEKAIKFNLYILDLIPQTLRPYTKNLCDFIIQEMFKDNLRNYPRLLNIHDVYAALLQTFPDSLITDEQFYILIEKSLIYFSIIPKERLTPLFYTKFLNFIIRHHHHNLFLKLYDKFQIVFQDNSLLLQRLQTHIEYVSLIQRNQDKIKQK
jgi:hypothetical protein